MGWGELGRVAYRDGLRGHDGQGLGGGNGPDVGGMPGESGFLREWAGRHSEVRVGIIPEAVDDGQLRVPTRARYPGGG